MSDFLQPHGPQHTRLPCPSLCPAVYSNSCPLSLWCHLTISFSVASFSCPQSFPASGSFPLRQLFTSVLASGVLASVSVPPMNVQVWFPLGLTDLISLQSKGLSRVFSSTFQKQGIGYVYGSIPVTCPVKPHEMRQEQLTKGRSNGKTKYAYYRCHKQYPMVIIREIFKHDMSRMGKYVLSKLQSTLGSLPNTHVKCVSNPLLLIKYF